MEALVTILRNRGWLVASHNDYPLDKSAALRTYWSFSRGHQFIEGDGADDVAALTDCITQADRFEPKPEKPTMSDAKIIKPSNGVEHRLRVLMYGEQTPVSAGALGCCAECRCGKDK